MDRIHKEIRLGKRFTWGKESWCVPAVYLCDSGLVADFGVEIEPERLKAYMDKRDLFPEEETRFNEDEQEQIRSEHPLNVYFSPEIYLNDIALQRKHGCGGMSWYPQSCQPEGLQNDRHIRGSLTRYGLDLSRGWSIYRHSFSWLTKQAPVVKSIRLRLEREPVNIPGDRFTVTAVGDRVTLTHPVTGAAHTLTVQKLDALEMDPKRFPERRPRTPHPTVSHKPKV